MMDVIQLLKNIDTIDKEYVLEADCDERKEKKSFLKYSALAACFAICFMLAPTIKSGVTKRNISLPIERRIFKIDLKDRFYVWCQDDGYTYSPLIENSYLKLWQYIFTKNDRIIFDTEDDSKLDITEQCSDTEYFHYQYTYDGAVHDVYVGGTVENVGWIEYLTEEASGRYITVFMSDSLARIPGTPVWIEKAASDYGIPFENIWFPEKDMLVE